MELFDALAEEMTRKGAKGIPTIPNKTLKMEVAMETQDKDIKNSQEAIINDENKDKRVVGAATIVNKIATQIDVTSDAEPVTKYFPKPGELAQGDTDEISYEDKETVKKGNAGKGIGEPSDGKCRETGEPVEHKGRTGKKEREGRGVMSVETSELKPRSEEVKGIADELIEMMDDDDIEDLIDELKGMPEEIPVTGEIVKEAGIKDILGKIMGGIKAHPVATGIGAASIGALLAGNSNSNGWDKWQDYGCTPELGYVNELREAANKRGLDQDLVYNTFLQPMEGVIDEDQLTESADGIQSITPYLQKAINLINNQSMNNGQMEVAMIGGMINNPDMSQG